VLYINFRNNNNNNNFSWHLIEPYYGMNMLQSKVGYIIGVNNFANL